LRSGQTATEYFDKYLFESQPDLLRDIARQMVSLIPDNADALAGLELGGIPIATMLSQLSGIPTLFVRKAAKTYGTCKLAEGGDVRGQNLVIVEDVVTTGGQVVTSATELRNLGATVRDVICVIDRELGGPENLRGHGLKLQALFTTSEVKFAVGRNIVMQLSISQIEIQDCPTASAAQCIWSGAETLLPFIKASETGCDRLLDRAWGFSVATQIPEILLMENCGVRRNQFLHLETFDLKSWRIVRKACQHLLNLPDPARSTGVIVIVMLNDQLLGNTFQLFGIEW
jgi:orotate phosphoribosyltransferase